MNINQHQSKLMEHQATTNPAIHQPSAMLSPFEGLRSAAINNVAYKVMGAEANPRAQVFVGLLVLARGSSWGRGSSGASLWGHESSGGCFFSVPIKFRSQ